MAFPIQGCDYSFAHEDPLALVRAGIHSVGRYAGPADHGKVITYAELKSLNAVGISVWLFYELNPGEWRGGYSAGLRDGQATRQWARTTLWWDNLLPIYATYDENVDPSMHDTAVAYQRGFNDGQAVPAGGGAYGDGYLLRILRDEQHLITYTMLSDSSSFTESRFFMVHGNPTIVQYYGNLIPGLSGVDKCQIFQEDWGQNLHPVPQPPAPPVTPSEVDVFLYKEPGSDSVHAAGLGPNGVMVVQAAHLATVEAGLVLASGRKEAATILPAETGLTANIQKGS